MHAIAFKRYESARQSAPSAGSVGDGHIAGVQADMARLSIPGRSVVVHGGGWFAREATVFTAMFWANKNPREY